MEWLNYHHLLYFWFVAKEGSVRAAAEQLHIAQPSISAQVHQLEEAFGEKLFRRSGRGLALTDAGQLVFRYADDIFSLGRELLSAVKQRPGPRAIPFHVGIMDSLPKLVTAEILKPILRLPQPVRVVCRERDLVSLLHELAAHRLDLLLADGPASRTLPVKTFSHLLGSCGVTFCAAPKLAAQLRRGFPRSLHGAPALLPTENTALRMTVDKWFDSVGVKPMIVAELEDSSLMKAMAMDGQGFVPVPSVVAAETDKRYGFQRIADVEACACQFYAITVERKLKHPAAVAITESAPLELFARNRTGVARQQPHLSGHRLEQRADRTESKGVAGQRG